MTNNVYNIDYYQGVNDGAEIFKHQMTTLLNMDSKKRRWIFGYSSVTDILNGNTADEIMARIGLWNDRIQK